MSSGTRVIPQEKGGQYQRWSAPVVQSGPGHRGPLTVNQIEEIQNRAREEGYQHGRAEGLKAAEADRQHLKRLLTTLAVPLVDLERQLEEELVALAKVLARQLVRRELKVDPAQIIGVVREAIAALPAGARDIQVHLHPEDAALVRDLLAPEQGERPWRIIDDPVLTRGDCQVLTETSRIDASLESRLTALVTASLGGNRESDEPRGDG